MERKLSVRAFEKSSWVYLTRFSPFQEIAENSFQLNLVLHGTFWQFKRENLVQLKTPPVQLLSVGTFLTMIITYEMQVIIDKDNNPFTS